MIFYSHANKTYFHNKGFTLNLVLKVNFWKSKWPVTVNSVVCIFAHKKNKEWIKKNGKLKMIHMIFFSNLGPVVWKSWNGKASLPKRRLMLATQILLCEPVEVYQVRMKVTETSQHATKNRIDQETWAIWGDAVKWYTREYVVLYRVTSHELPWKNTDKGWLPFTWEIQKFYLENQMAHAIPFG